MGKLAVITSALHKRHYAQGLIQMFFRKEDTGSLYNSFIKEATGTFGLKIAVTGMNFFTSLLLVRLLGSTGYGNYAYAISWIMLLGVPAGLGLNRLLVRNIAVYQSRSAWSLMSGILRWADRVVLFASLSVASLSAVVLWFSRTNIDSQMFHPLWVALVLLPLTALMAVRLSVIQGLGHIVIAQLPDLLFQPLLFIALIGGLSLFVERHITASWVVGMHAVTVGIALLIGMRILRKMLPPAAKSSVPVYETRRWLGSALSMMSVGGMSVISSRIDILLLGGIMGADAVGIYNVAIRGAELVTFILMPVHQTLGPVVASLYAGNDMRRLQGMVAKSTRIAFLLSLPIALGLVVFGYWFLLVFGPEFVRGQTALAILSIGQLANVATGPVILLLIMTAYERVAAVSIGIGAALNILFNATLIPIWGLEGAAIATASSTVVWNALMVIWVYKKLGIHSTALGRISFRRALNRAV